MRRILVLSLLLMLPAFAGCLGGAESTAPETMTAASAADAGATSGPAPSAAKTPYRVEDGGSANALTIYPLAMPTNAPRAPVTLEFSGAFGPTDCSAVGQLPAGGAGLSNAWITNDFSDSLQQGDVFAYDIEMRFTNSDQSWGDIHLFYALGSASDAWTDPTSQERGEVVLNFTGQSYMTETPRATVTAACWFGSTATPIPWTITVTLTFAEGAVPASTPVLIEVPDNATRLYVRGVPLDDTLGVNSHYRVFNPDDSLLCECSLGSNEEFDSVELPGPGAYVVLVDHTANGFVSFALDAPGPALLPLESAAAIYPLVTSEGGSVDELVEVTFPSTPLRVFAWVTPGAGTNGQAAGSGKGYELTLTNARGEVLRQKMEGYVTTQVEAPGFGSSDWVPVPTPGDWEFYVDHHAYDVGTHVAHVQAEQMRGDAVVFAVHYVRA